MKKTFEEIHDKIRAYVYYRILKGCGNVTLSEDFTSDVMIKIYRNYDKFDAKDATVYTYARNAAKNKLIDYYKSKKKRNATYTMSIEQDTYDDSGQPIIQIADSYLNPIQELANKELGEVIDEAMNTLKDKYKEVATMYFIDQEKMVDIVRETGIKEGTVKTCIHKSRKQLKEKLAITWNNYIRKSYN